MDENPDAVKAFGGDSAPGTSTASKTEVGLNPGKFTRTNQDPVMRGLTLMETRNYWTQPESYSGLMVFWAFYRADPEGGRVAYKRHYDVDLDESKLAPEQRALMGLPV